MREGGVIARPVPESIRMPPQSYRLRSSRAQPGRLAWRGVGRHPGGLAGEGGPDQRDGGLWLGRRGGLGCARFGSRFPGCGRESQAALGCDHQQAAERVQDAAGFRGGGQERRPLRVGEQGLKLAARSTPLPPAAGGSARPGCAAGAGRRPVPCGRVLWKRGGCAGGGSLLQPGDDERQPVRQGGEGEGQTHCGRTPHRPRRRREMFLKCSEFWLASRDRLAAGVRTAALQEGRPTLIRRSRLERCQSGRSGRSRKPLSVQAFRGFESHPLRQSPVHHHPQMNTWDRLFP